LHTKPETHCGRNDNTPRWKQAKGGLKTDKTLNFSEVPPKKVMNLRTLGKVCDEPESQHAQSD
jgi:hypothetical protein